MGKTEEKALKEELKKSADSYKEQLEIEVNESLDQIQRIIKIAALAAGGAFISYSIYKALFESEEDKKVKKNKSKRKKTNFFQPVIKAVVEISAAYLLSIAKQKLQAYIQNLENAKTAMNENTEGDY